MFGGQAWWHKTEKYMVRFDGFVTHLESGQKFAELYRYDNSTTYILEISKVEELFHDDPYSKEHPID